METTQVRATAANGQGYSVALTDFLPKDTTVVNEEQLFIAQLSRALMQSGGKVLYEKFKSIVAGLLSDAAKNKRRVQLEDVGTAALNQLVQSKTITKAKAELFINKSWTAAQLDKDPALWDSIGGPTDPTRSVASIQDAVKSVDSRLKDIDSGKLGLINPMAGVQSKNSVGGRNLRKFSTSTSTSTITSSSDAAFLWKPVADSSGTATILFPRAIGENSHTVTLMSSTGAILAQGTFTSFGEDGLRVKYIFPKPGSSYPADSSVVVTLQNGEQISFPIPDPARRLE